MTGTNHRILGTLFQMLFVMISLMPLIIYWLVVLTWLIAETIIHLQWSAGEGAGGPRCLAAPYWPAPHLQSPWKLPASSATVPPWCQCEGREVSHHTAKNRAKQFINDTNVSVIFFAVNINSDNKKTKDQWWFIQETSPVWTLSACGFKTWIEI